MLKMTRYSLHYKQTIWSYVLSRLRQAQPDIGSVYTTFIDLYITAMKIAIECPSALSKPGWYK
jgi:hypothetical protein